MKPQRDLQEQWEKWMKPRRDFQEQWEKLKRPLEIEKFVIDTLGQTEYEKIKVDQNGAISVEGNVFSANEFSDIYNELIESIENLPSPLQVLDAILGYLKRINKPIAKFLLIFIFQFIINISSNLSTPYFEETIFKLRDNPKRELVKAIRQEAQQDFPPDFLKEYRFVTTNILKVRRGPSTKHQVAGEIYLGQVAHLIKKGKNWSLIEYTDENTDQQVTGWVFSRYLLNFKK